MTNRAKELLEKYSENLTYSEMCPQLTPEDGVIVWQVDHGLSTSNVVSGLFDTAGNEVEKVMTILTANSILISWSSDVVVPANTYEILVVSGGAYGGVRIDKGISPTSTNPVQNAAIYQVIGTVEETLNNINTGRNEE